MLLLMLSLGLTVAAEEPSDVLDLDPKKFDNPTSIDNEWYPMKPGMRFVWEGTSVDDEGDSETHRVIFTVTDLTKEIAGVETIVCWDQDIVDGEELVESEIVFFAQDNDGAIWSLGEYPEEYEDDQFVDAPCWIHGILDAKGGMLIPAKPAVGSPRFFQGWAPDVGFSDLGIVEKIGKQKMIVPFGTFDDVLVIDEWNLEEPDAHALKYYARGVGHIAIRSRGEGDKETLDLVEMRKLNPAELKQARDAALKLEASAYDRSQNVYAHTEPSKLGGKATSTRPQAKKSTAPKRISEEKAKGIAVKKVAGDVTGVDLERKLGQTAFVVEVLTKDGEEIDVIIDPQTGKVLGTEK
jgi:uncharacterized membrane protein YkoI